MLVVINHVLTTAPTYDTTDLVGFPINAILDYPMITPAGLAAFLAPEVNDMLRRVLAVWTKFLDSRASRYVLNDSPTGWLSPAARIVATRRVRDRSQGAIPRLQKLERLLHPELQARS